MEGRRGEGVKMKLHYSDTLFVMGDKGVNALVALTDGEETYEVTLTNIADDVFALLVALNEGALTLV